MTAPLTWGQRVTICDETSAAFGRIGIYEGAITDHPEALRVRFPAGVIIAKRHQLLSTEHPVCIGRRLRQAGQRPPRVRWERIPPCYLKDYGPTAAERAYAAWEHGLESDDPETFRSLWSDMQRLHFAELMPRPPRRLRAEAVAQRRRQANDRRWLRTRKALRAAAKATGSTP